MKQRIMGATLAGSALLLELASNPAFAAGGAVEDKFKGITFAVFGVIIAITMYITYWAAKHTHTTSEFYAAGRTVSGLQNGWAIAGDYLSAASFLGIAGLISLYGYDGFMYSVGWLVAYITVLLVIAEPCRNIGKYTLGDVLAFRNDPKKTKTVAALSTITVSTFYLTAQMVGGGVLIKTLIGIDYEVSVISVGVLMLAYVVFGGMKATTWVQIVKAVLLVTASVLLVIFTWAPYGFSLPGFLQAVVGDAKVQAQVAKLLGDAASTMSPQELGQRFLEPGLFLKSPIDQISLGMALVFGTAGMPHILMRFFTVPDARTARKSVLYATGFIGYFYILTFIIGFGAITFLMQDASYYAVAADGTYNRIDDLRGGTNMAAVHLANAVGGSLFLGFISAVAFATILAVVAGLTLAGASAISHDLYANVFARGTVCEHTEVRLSRIAAVAIGLFAIFLGYVFEKQNVAFMVGLAFAIAASCNFPVLLMSLHWPGTTTRGAVAGGIVGLVLAVACVILSPAVWVKTFGFTTAPFPYDNPALFSVTAAFVTIWLVSRMDRSTRADAERAAYAAQRVRTETGIGAIGASAH